MRIILAAGVGKGRSSQEQTRSISPSGHYNVSMAFVRAKKRGDKVYYYLVENKREGKKIRQKVLKYLGTSPEGKTKKELCNDKN
jgi:hypothetical protein